MYRQKKLSETLLRGEKATSGETIIDKMKRMINNKEPIKGDDAKMIFTAANSGVLPETDIRTNRWELAVEGTKIISDQYRGKQDPEWVKKAAENMKTEQKTESTNSGGTQGTEGTK